MDKGMRPCECGNTKLKIEEHKTYSNRWIAYAYCPNPNCNVNPGVGLSRFEKIARRKAVSDWNRGSNDNRTEN